jgi:hypothetical protein
MRSFTAILLSRNIETPMYEAELRFYAFLNLLGLRRTSLSRQIVAHSRWFGWKQWKLATAVVVGRQV